MNSTQLIVVGIGDTESDHYLAALHVAADEARRRKAGIALVHGSRSEVVSPVSPADTAVIRNAHGQSRLDQAASLLSRITDPDIMIKQIVSDATVVDALMAAAENADLIILQRRTIPSVARIYAGSTTSVVTAQASCPVLVVRDDQNTQPQHRSVVVGVDADGHSARAVDFAIREAALRDVPLRVVYAWDVSGTVVGDSYLPAAESDVLTARHHAEAIAGHAVSDASAAHPRVVVHTTAVRGSADLVLTVEAQTADLLVVGRHRNAHLHSFGLGGLARHLLAESPCPVAITPTATPHHKPHRGKQPPGVKATA